MNPHKFSGAAFDSLPGKPQILVVRRAAAAGQVE
jgi:hypothetical protein